MAVEILSVLLLNVRLADYSIRDDTIEEAIKSFEVIVERLKSLVLMAIENPQVFYVFNEITVSLDSFLFIFLGVCLSTIDTGSCLW